MLAAFVGFLRSLTDSVRSVDDWVGPSGTRGQSLRYGFCADPSPYLQSLGVTAVVLLPVCEFDETDSSLNAVFRNVKVHAFLERNGPRASRA
jgi:hypothetical protein